MLLHCFLNVFLITAIAQSTPPPGLSWDFSRDSPNTLPKGWQTRGRSSRPVYQVKSDTDGNRYIAAQSDRSDVQLGVNIDGPAKEFSILSWRWRAHELPAGADERKVKTMDSAASVYAVFGSRIFPKILKYVWSTSVPTGTTFHHPDSGRMVIIVVHTGSPSGEWQEVRRDLADDFKMAFGSKPLELIAIGIKTDSDSTRSSARADYDDVRLTRR
jgi:hypothetical protein